MISSPHPALSSNEEERGNALRSLRSLAAIESVCIGVHPWLKNSHAGCFHEGQAQ